MAFHIHTQSDLDAGLAALGKADPRFAALLAKAGPPPLRRRPDGFAGLAAIIVAQQLSTASADAIWGRLKAALDPLEAGAFPHPRSGRSRRSPALSTAADSPWTSSPICRPMQPTRRSPPSMASAHGRPTSISSPVSGMPTPGQPAISPSRKR
jgi:hypothetical protein